MSEANEGSPQTHGSRCCSCGSVLTPPEQIACDRCLRIYMYLRAIDEMDALVEEKRKRDSANAPRQPEPASGDRLHADVRQGGDK